MALVDSGTEFVSSAVSYSYPWGRKVVCQRSFLIGRLELPFLCNAAFHAAVTEVVCRVRSGSRVVHYMTITLNVRNGGDTENPFGLVPATRE